MSFLQVLYRESDFRPTWAVCHAGCVECCSHVILCGPEEGREVADAWTGPMPGPFTRTSMAQREPCPFLAGHRCSVYAVRPGVCRSYWSREHPPACHGEVSGALSSVLLQRQSGVIAPLQEWVRWYKGATGAVDPRSWWDRAGWRMGR